MKFKIACPHCSHSLSLVEPKPGKYKPKCSNCGLQFAIVVEAGEPPKIRIGKLASAAKLSQSPTSGFDETIALENIAKTTQNAAKSTGFDETITPPSLVDVLKPVGVAVTVASDSATQAHGLVQRLEGRGLSHAVRVIKVERVEQ